VTTKTAMPKIMRVADVMTSDVMFIEAHATVFEASSALTERKVGGAPVLRGSAIVGVVSKTDLTDTRKDLEVRVDKVMTPVVYAVRATDPAFLAVQLMVDESIHRVIVVDDLGNLAGIVTSSDILQAIRNGKPIVPLNDRVELDYVDLRQFGNKA
jgi:predicted transcriptional regulator